MLSEGRLLPTLLDLRLPTPGIFSSAAKMSSPSADLPPPPPPSPFLPEMEQALLPPALLSSGDVESTDVWP